MSNIHDTAIRKTVEDNEDLNRKIILLQQQLEDKERRIKVLEGKFLSNSTKGKESELVNSATQVSL